jgi:hypothetical protein
MSDLTQQHYDIQMKSVRDAAGLLQTIDLPALIAHAQKTRNTDDMMLLMALNHARVHLPDIHEKTLKT